MTYPYEVLAESPLFANIASNEVGAMLECLQATQKSFEKGDFILRPGEAVENVGMVLSGHATVMREDYWGNRELLTTIGPGNLFAEVFACIPQSRANVSVVAGDGCTVMLLNIARILTTCSSSCAFHARLVENLVRVLAQKNLLMNEKLGHLSRRSTREKLLSYLSAEAQRQGKSRFSIPFNRQQLADYLSVDRSAMSAELSRMRKDGLVDYSRSYFELKETEDVSH
ncbi:MAG: Crp/Fnr family transcriptional regulator [Coriobacteriales bacterium]|jgi:CRP-like cAMP-binding protein